MYIYIYIYILHILTLRGCPAPPSPAGPSRPSCGGPPFGSRDRALVSRGVCTAKMAKMKLFDIQGCEIEEISYSRLNACGLPEETTDLRSRTALRNTAGEATASCLRIAVARRSAMPCRSDVSRTACSRTPYVNALDTISYA